MHVAELAIDITIAGSGKFTSSGVMVACRLRLLNFVVNTFVIREESFFSCSFSSKGDCRFLDSRNSSIDSMFEEFCICLYVGFNFNEEAR